MNLATFLQNIPQYLETATQIIGVASVVAASIGNTKAQGAVLAAQKILAILSFNFGKAVTLSNLRK